MVGQWRIVQSRTQLPSTGTEEEGGIGGVGGLKKTLNRFAS